MTKPRVWWVVAAGVLALAASARAQESTSDWIKRILDPAAIGVKPFPDSQLNRKITVDTIHLADPSKRIAIYMAPLDKMQAVSDYFTESLGVKPTVTDPGTPHERHLFDLIGAGTYPPAAQGLTIEIIRSPWVDGKTQITMEMTVKK